MPIFKRSRERVRGEISLIACILIGLTLLASGTGKIIAAEEAPAQVVDFISNIIPDIFITPGTISFMYDIFIPRVIPWAEFILGACLLVGFLPRLMAILTIPLLLAFLGTNLWSIIQGGYTTCASCFGIWEKYFGSLTPVQSLIYDLVLIALAILIIIIHPAGFLSSRRWLDNLGKGKKFDAATVRLKMRVFSEQLGNLGARVMAFFRLIGKGIREHPLIAIFAGICVLGLLAYGAIAASTHTAAPGNDTTAKIPVASDISVSELSETSAVISWTTDEPAISNIEIYTEDHIFVITVTNKKPVNSHQMLVGGLSPDTTYYFNILSEDKQALSQEHSFKTLAPAPSQFTISYVRVSALIDSSATITWGTNRPATSKVEYWIPGAKDRNTISNDTLTTQHSINLTSLEVDAIYHYQIRSIDVSGNQVISPELALSGQTGKPAPDFTLNSLDGRTVTLSDYRGKLVMLDFWLWSCSACRKKMSIIQEAYAKIPTDKIAILSIHPKVKESIIQMYVDDTGLTFPVLLDSEGVVSDLYKVPVLPTTFLIDGDGIIRLIDPEFSNTEDLERLFNTFLKGT
ncbi:MAG: redoxin domain-containing protein [Chloroflexi bacterium]|nr:redoxin domain-containing protein [Chloroflexota bacterium]